MPTDGGRAIQLGTVVAAPGTLVTGWLTVGEDWRRRAEGVAYAVACGTAPGPILYLQAVSDGDELNGLAVIRRLLGELEPTRLRGALVCVPVANPGAFAAGQPHDPRDNRKLNRCFPGHADGSVTERLAHALFHQLVVQCDLVLDLHQNGTTPMIPEVRVRTGRCGARHADCLALARAFGLPYILDEQGPPGQLARAAPARGIPAIDPELGGNTGFGTDAVALGLAGVRRVMQQYGLLEGEPAFAPTPFIARRLVPLTAEAGGVLEFVRALGDRVVPGETVALCTDVFGGRPVSLRAPAEGVLWICRTHPLVSAGDTVGAVGVEAEN